MHENQQFAGSYTVGALADSFYEYLLKIWLISDRKADKYREYYDRSSQVGGLYT
jgi:hypothetical protein